MLPTTLSCHQDYNRIVMLNAFIGTQAEIWLVCPSDISTLNKHRATKRLLKRKSKEERKGVLGFIRKQQQKSEEKLENQKSAEFNFGLVRTKNVFGPCKKENNTTPDGIMESALNH